MPYDSEKKDLYALAREIVKMSKIEWIVCHLDTVLTYSE